MKLLVFGVTGTAGSGVLDACIESPQVTEVRTLSRREPFVKSPKLRSSLHGDFRDYSTVADAFAGIHACFWCLGISATQVPDEAAYRVITSDYAMAAASQLRQSSPGAVFHFISGQGASLGSRMMWARVKAETERDLLRQGDAFCWRPAMIDGDYDTGPLAFRLLRPAFRLLRGFKSLYITGRDIGRAMIVATASGEKGRIIHNPEMRDMAERALPSV